MTLEWNLMVFEDIFCNNYPVFLAPMAGITDAPFRELVYSFGATAVVSEMVSSEALIRNNRKTYKRLASNNALKIVQIVGADPYNMAESAIINENLGADVIDINMGCPARKIVSNDSGAALLKNESLAVAIAKSVVKAVKIPVTLKMRLGWDYENINCLSLAKKFEEIGIRMLSIHCRTRNQMYTGKADWLAIAELKNIIKIPYLCNGDIKSPKDAVEALKKSNANGVMIGRGALGKPWLLGQIVDFLKGTEYQPVFSVKEQLKIIMKHFHDTIDFYGEYHGIRIFRKHFCWYSNGMKNASKFREIINHSDNLAFIQECVHAFFEKNFLYEDIK